MYTFYLYEVVHDICYQGFIGNNLFIITNKVKVAYIRPTQTPFHGRHFGELKSPIKYPNISYQSVV